MQSLLIMIYRFNEIVFNQLIATLVCFQKSIFLGHFSLPCFEATILDSHIPFIYTPHQRNVIHLCLIASSSSLLQGFSFYVMERLWAYSDDVVLIISFLTGHLKLHGKQLFTCLPFYRKC